MGQNLGQVVKEQFQCLSEDRPNFLVDFKWNYLKFIARYKQA